VQGVIEYLEKYPELPEDAYFLDSLLDHPRERIADKALAKLEAMESEGKLKTKVPKSLDERLKSIQITSMDPEMQGRAKALREKLKA
jgi:lipoate-protein ligase A